MCVDSLTVKCEDCGKTYCNSCSSLAHKSPKRRNHHVVLCSQVAGPDEPITKIGKNSLCQLLSARVIIMQLIHMPYFKVGPHCSVCFQYKQLYRLSFSFIVFFKGSTSVSQPQEDETLFCGIAARHLKKHYSCILEGKWLNISAASKTLKEHFPKLVSRTL